MVDAPVDESNDPYSEPQIRDLSNGVLVELKRLVDAEIARRWEDCKDLAPVAPKTRAPRATKKK